MSERIDARDFLAVAQRRLEAGDAAGLAAQVAARWSPRQLCRLLGDPDADVRRVTAMTLGLVGDASCVGCLARALHDDDAQVNEMAEHGLWSIWFRSCNPEAARAFNHGVALLGEAAYPEAIVEFEHAAAADPNYAEAYNQCAIAHFFLGQWAQSIEDCQRVLAIMPAHFGAMAGMGHGHAHLDVWGQAVQCYRRAIAINPRMNPLRDAVARIEQKLRTIESATDAANQRPRS